ncbi:hypothetical protein G9A89_001227, partial [Geosiphon pyriformis]
HGVILNRFHIPYSSGTKFAQSSSSSNQRPEYRYVKGRRFHNVINSPYSLPNDESEINRLKLQHEVTKLAWAGNFLAPVREILERGGQVLDVGCGPGAWTLDTASHYPSSNFFGFDLSPKVFPTTNLPKNVQFQQANILEGLYWVDSNKFDLVHQRFLVLAFTPKQWEKVINELIRVTKQGGWIELTEVNVGLARCGPVTRKFCHAWEESVRKQGIEPYISNHLENFLQSTNSVENIQFRERDIPLGSWGGPIGHLGKQNIRILWEDLRAIITSRLDITDEEFDDLLEVVENEYEIYKTVDRTYRVYGRKV